MVFRLGGLSKTEGEKKDGDFTLGRSGLINRKHRLSRDRMSSGGDVWKDGSGKLELSLLVSTRHF